MNKLLASLALLIVPLLVLRSFNEAGAHGSGGTLTADNNGYKIDIDYPTETLEAQKPTWFNARLLKDDQAVEISNVEVTVSDGNKQLFFSNVQKDPGRASAIIITLPYAATFQMHTIFYKDNAKLAEATLDMPVEGAPPPTGTSNTKGWHTENFYSKEGLILLVAGLALGRFISNFLKPKT